MMDPQVLRERRRAPPTHMGPGYWIVVKSFRLLLRAGWHLKTEGLDRLPPRGPFLMTPNHASEIDPIVLSAAMPFRVTYLAGQELDRYPLLFTLIRLFNPLFLPRGLRGIGAHKDCVELRRRWEVRRGFA